MSQELIVYQQPCRSLWKQSLLGNLPYTFYLKCIYQIGCCFLVLVERGTSLKYLFVLSRTCTELLSLKSIGWYSVELWQNGKELSLLIIYFPKLYEVSQWIRHKQIVVSIFKCLFLAISFISDAYSFYSHFWLYCLFNLFMNFKGWYIVINFVFYLSYFLCMYVAVMLYCVLVLKAI